MTLTAKDIEHLKPMVEKAAEARCQRILGIPLTGLNEEGQRSAIAIVEHEVIAFLNACLDGGVAAEADGFNRIDGMEADSTPRPDGATFDFRALILSLGEAK